MRKLLISLFMVVMTITMTFAEDGLKIKVEGMYMDVFGTDEHVGDVYEFSVTDDGYEKNYGADFDPINLNMAPGLGVRAEIIYMNNLWGVGISGWLFSSNGDLKGTASSGSGYVSGVRMWDHTLPPLADESESSGRSPVDYYAGQLITVWTAEAFLIRTLASRPISEINMSLGAKIGNIDMLRANGLSNHAWVPWPAFGSGHYWDNHVTLNETANSKFLGIGPMIGFSGMAKSRFFYIEGFLSQSVLLGNMVVDDKWIDIDDIYDTVLDVSSEPYELWTGTFNFEKEEFIAVPVTEFQIEAGVDIADKVRIGLGGFVSIWWHAPAPPTWHVPGQWYWADGSGFELEYRNLVFIGASASVTVKL